MTLLFASDTRMTGESRLDSEVYTAAGEWARYQAKAAAGGYAIDPTHEAFLQSVISALIAANAWTCWEMLLVAGCGTKDLATTLPRVLPLRGEANVATAVPIGSLTLSTASGVPYLNFPTASTFLDFSVILRSGPKMGALLCDIASDTSGANGIGMTWTASVAHRFAALDGQFFISPGVSEQAQLKASSTWAVATKDVMTWRVDFEEQLATLWRNGGVPLLHPVTSRLTSKSIDGFPVHVTANTAYTVRLIPIGGSNRWVTFAGLASTHAPMDAVGEALKALVP
jgi:hypothetical protein